jgi:drug/metabolite transporter (DMT)-like permease
LLSGSSIGLVIGLGILGTGVAYILYYFIVDHLGAITASSAAYIPASLPMSPGRSAEGTRRPGGGWRTR